MESGVGRGIDIEINALARLPARPASTATCDKCHSRRLFRVGRRPYEKALRFLGLHPYICDRCGRRTLMFGRRHPFNWRSATLRITLRSRFLKNPA